MVEVARATIKTPPRVKTETAIRQTKGAIGFYTDDLFTLAGEPKGEGELGERAKAIVEALERHLGVPEGRGPAPVDERLADRPRAVRRRSWSWSWTPGSRPTRCWREAEAEADRVEREMAVIARQLWGTTFPGEPVPPDDAGRPPRR